LSVSKIVVLPIPIQHDFDMCLNPVGTDLSDILLFQEKSTHQGEGNSESSIATSTSAGWLGPFYICLPMYVLFNMYLTLSVMTSGFKAWTRGYAFWSTTDQSWGFTLSPYCVIAVFFLLVLASPLLIDGAFLPGAENRPLRGESLVLANPHQEHSKLRQIRDEILNGL
jgi:hypothetical protein